jgi:transcriptional regulator GlxA family with amidase domain
VAQAIIYMSEHLDQPLRVAELAVLANLSPAHFTVLFKQQTGCSPRDYLHLLRIHRACQMLRGSTLPVKEVAARLGYQDQFHFSRQFKAFQGLSPTEYRET